MLPAPNPWRNTETLGDNLEGTGRKVLVGLREIISDWPGEKTPVLGPEERHLRFIMAVAGYPDIDMATRPFDMPLQEKSTRALRISRMLDDISGMDKGTSLRSSLLNRDFNFRQGDDQSEQALEDAHKECMKLLMTRTRQLDGCDVSLEKLLDPELALLRTLHGDDTNTRSKWWPRRPVLTNREKGDLSIVIGTCEKPEDMPSREEDSEEFENWREAKEKFVRQENLMQEGGLGRRFSISDSAPDMVRISFQFHYVQNWLRRNFPTQEGLDSTAQRFLRGSSILLELVTSEVRARIARSVGIGSITADGGGRVEFLCPKGIESEMRKKIERSTWQFLLLKGKEGGSEATNNIRFESTVSRWSQACIGQQANRESTIELFRQVQSKLPPFSIVGKVDGSGELTARLNQLDSPKIIEKSSLNCDGCWLCNGEQVPDPDSIDVHMGINGKLDRVISDYCPFHRLIYLLGHDQRLKDSTLRPDGGPSQSGGDREVAAVARVDGNSLGILFGDRYEDSFWFHESQDRRRRRSFRFNAGWWEALQFAVNKHGPGDEIAAWITAGDDVVLSEYMPVDEDSKKGVRLKRALETWAAEVEKLDDELDEGMFLSFAAGMAVKRKAGRDSSGNRVYDKIVSQVLRSGTYEEKAKNRWKTMIEDEHDGDFPPMLTLTTDGEKVRKRNRAPDSDWRDSLIRGTKSILVEEEGEYAPSDQGDICPPKPFQQWDWDLIDEFCDYYPDLERDDEPNLKRHYKILVYSKNEWWKFWKKDEWSLNETLLTLLPPKDVTVDA